MANTERFEASSSGPFTAEGMLAVLMSNPSVAVAALRDGRVRRANVAWQNLFGGAGQVGEPAIAAIFPNGQSAERFLRLVDAHSGEGVIRIEHVLARADGDTFSAEVVVKRLGIDAEAPFDAVWQVQPLSGDGDLRRELREMEDYYRALSTYQWDLTFVIDRDFYVSYASRSVENLLGFRVAEVLGERVDRFLHPDEAAAARATFERVVAGEAAGQSESFRVRIRHRDGDYRTLSCRQRSCLDNPRIAGVVFNAHDITREIEVQQQREGRLSYAARLREALFELATSDMPDSDWQIRRILEAAAVELAIHSASFWRFHEAERAFVCEYTFLRDDGSTVSDPMRDAILESRFPLYVREIRTHRPIVVDDILQHHAVSQDHLERLVAANVGAMLDFPVARGGQTLGVMSLEYAGASRQWDTDEIGFAAGLSLLIALALERAERAAAAEHTEFMAMHDALTGLANRNRADGVLRAAIAAASDARRVGLLLIDLDEFKEINDTFGHRRGDDLLVEVSRILLDCTAQRGLVARMGGDEFLIVVEDANKGELEPLAQSIIDRLSAQQLLADTEQRVGASVGIAVYPDDAQTPEALLANADIAMYQAKEAGKNQYFAFNAKLAQRLKLQRELDGEIRDALRHGEFSMFYQPQINLATGKTIGLEALLRWEHPARGLLLPNTFMAAAQHNGLIDTITKWAVTEVCEQSVSWQRAGLEAMPVSVNVTGRQFHDRHLPAIVAQALMRTGMPAYNLILEVTEESLIENSRTSDRVLAELRRLGIRIAIDDFGVGYSSLSYLRRLVGSQIKLDKAFIDGLPHDEESSAIVGAVIAIARRLKYTVIAEGIETKGQVEYLRAAGCEAGQGFYFGAPLSADEIAAFMAEEAARDR